MRPPVFDPARTTRVFRVALSDHHAAALLPSLFRRLTAAASGATLDASPLGPDTRKRMADGRLDLAVAAASEQADDASFHQRVPPRDRFVCVVRRDHPGLDAPFTPEGFAVLPHALASLTDREDGVVDHELARLGLKRRIVSRTRDFPTAAAVVAESDLVVTLPPSFAHSPLVDGRSRILEPPPAPPGFDVVALRHARLHDDPAHVWLRGLIVRPCADVPCAGNKLTAGTATATLPPSTAGESTG